MIKINQKHGFKVFDELIRLLRENLHPFDKAKRPQEPEFLPKNLPLGGLEHALYLFYICLYMRRRLKSYQAFEGFKILYENSPELFDPKKIQTNPAYYHATLIEQLKKGRLALGAEENARFWIENSLELFHYWNGDPRNLFNVLNEKNRNTPQAFELICSNIIKDKKKNNSKRKNYHLFDNDSKNRGFRGFLQKMVSMLSYFYVDANIIPSYNFPSPVDFHVSRFLLIQEIIKITGNKDAINVAVILPSGRKITATYTSRNNVSPNELADAIWLYSQLMCSSDPNKTRVKRIGEKKGRKTEYSVSKKVKKWTRRKVHKYEISCGICIFKQTCLGNVPDKPYYDTSKLLMIDKDHPTQPNLFPITPMAKINKPQTKINTVKKEKEIEKYEHPSLFDEK